MKIYLGLIAAAALTLTACGDNKPAQPAESASPAATAAASETAAASMAHQELRLPLLQPPLPRPQPPAANAKP